MPKEESKSAVKRAGAGIHHSSLGIRHSSIPSRHVRELSVAAVLALILTALDLFAPAFFAPAPLLSRLTAETPALIVALGMALVMITRQIDISIGSVFGMTAVLAGSLLAAKVPLALAVPITVLAGATLGSLNGFLVAGLGLPSIVVTLATMVTWREALRLWQQGRFINLPDGAQWFGLGQTGGQWALVGVAVTMVALMAWAMRNIAAGRWLHAVGSDAEAARLAGIRPRAVTFGVFVLMGALAALASVANLVQSPQVDPNAGTGIELKAIAAAVVGGVAVTGGRGRLWGVFLGLLLLATINPALTYLHVEAYWEKAIQGLVILVAVMTDRAGASRNQTRHR